MTKVLVIEDERYLLEDITELLQYTDFEVQGANNGSQGLEVARDYVPDLIICDIMMPDLDGYQVLENIRGNPLTANTPFIFLTAKADRDLMRQGMDLGADDYLTKPFTSAELLTAINTRLIRQNQIVEHSEQKIENIKRQLTRMVTHELRTPLISINTVVDVISRQIGQLSPSELQELLDTISAGSKRLSHRVEQLIFVTQLEANMLTQEVIMRDGLPMRLWELLVAANNLARRFSYQQQSNVNVQLNDHDRDFDGDVQSARAQAGACRTDRQRADIFACRQPGHDFAVALWRQGHDQRGRRRTRHPGETACRSAQRF